MYSRIENAMQRTRRYWYEDGLGEMAKGAIFLLMGLTFLLEAQAPEGTLPRSFSAIALPVIVFGGILLARWLVPAAKSRLTYPRSGYVAYPRPARGRVLSIAAMALAVSTLIAVLVRGPEARTLISIAQGLFFSALFFYLGHWLGIARFYVVAVVSMVAGLAAYIAKLDLDQGLAAIFLAVGASLIISGALTLRSYLQNTQSSLEG